MIFLHVCFKRKRCYKSESFEINRCSLWQLLCSIYNEKLCKRAANWFTVWIYRQYWDLFGKFKDKYTVMNCIEIYLRSYISPTIHQSQVARRNRKTPTLWLTVATQGLYLLFYKQDDVIATLYQHNWSRSSYPANTKHLYNICTTSVVQHCTTFTKKIII